MQTHEVRYSRVMITSPSLWFSPYEDDHGAATPIPVKKLTKHFFSPVLFYGVRIRRIKTSLMLLLEILKQKFLQVLDKVHNVVRTLPGLKTSQSFKSQGQRVLTTKKGRICPEKQQQQNVCFLPTQTPQNIFLIFGACRGRKVAEHTGSTAQSELPNKNEKSYGEHTPAGTEFPSSKIEP